MKKITLLCFALMAGFALQAQDFTSTTISGTTVYNGAPGTTTQGTDGQNRVPITITHSNTQTIEAGADIACASATSFRNNSMFRNFNLDADFGIAVDFYVTDVEVAIGPVITPGGFPLTVNIYSTTAGAFPAGTLTFVGTGTITIFESSAVSIVSIPVTGMIPAGEALVAEAQLIDDGTDSNFMRFGCNNDGETDASYIMAVDCGAATPTPFSDLGLTQGWVMNVVGDDEEPLSVGDNLAELISIYPNPVSNRLNIEMPSNIDVRSATIFDILGKNTGVRLVNGTMDTSNLVRGIYILNIETTSGTLTQKIVKQ